MKGCLQYVWNIGALCSQTALNPHVEMAVICQIGYSGMENGLAV